MRSPRFRPIVYRVLGPILAEHGFRPRPDRNSAGVAVFVRELRGYENEIMFSLSQHISPAVFDVHAFQFSLRAPKGGMPSNFFRRNQADPNWWYYRTTEELVVALEEAASIIVSQGLSWLDTFTPGNVPRWDSLVPSIIGPSLEPYGFRYLGGKTPWGADLPPYLDTAWFADGKGNRAMVDMVIQGEVTPRLMKEISSSSQSDRVLHGPPYHYSSPEGFPEALRQAAAFFERNAAEWVRGGSECPVGARSAKEEA